MAVDYRNGEGYADPTYYNGVKGVAKPGEIYLYNDREVLIVKSHGDYCNILTLGNQKADSIEICGKYCNPGKLSYAFPDRLGNRVGKITDDELGVVWAEVALALAPEITKAEKPAETAEMKYQQCANDMLRETVDGLEKDLEQKTKETEMLQAQLGLLKGMYNDLLVRVFEKAI